MEDWEDSRIIGAHHIYCMKCNAYLGLSCSFESEICSACARGYTFERDEMNPDGPSYVIRDPSGTRVKPQDLVDALNKPTGR